MEKKKFKIISLILVVVTLIMFLLFVITNYKLMKTKAEIDTQKEQISQLYQDLELEKEYKHFFCYNRFDIRAITTNNVVLIGDTLDVRIGIFSMNYVQCDDTGKNIEPIILLAAGVDENKKLYGPFDTIPSSAWVGYLKLKTKELGTHQLNGIYHFAEKDSLTSSFRFSMEYTVIDQETYNAMKKY